MRTVRPHTRIVKPRTAKQKAAIAKSKTWRVPFASPAQAPTSSWWCGCSREELAVRARAEQARMAGTKFGRVTGSPSQE